MTHHDDDRGPEITGAFSALSLGFNLTRSQKSLLLRIGWVILVTTHIAWACGWLGVLGLIGFAKADELKELRQTVQASARVTLSQEIRAQATIRCRVTDQYAKDSITRYIDSLQIEYERIAGQRLTEPPCVEVPRQ